MIRLSDNLEINKPAPVDDRLGVFVSTASALSSVPEDRRYIGLTVIVDDGSGATEYWFKDGVTDANLEAKASGGPGGSQTLQQVTDEGNTTTTDIVLLDDAELVIGSEGQVLLDNGSRLKEGTIDAGLGGAKGIAQICAVGYEMKWEAGRLYIMNDGGTTIRESRYNFTNTPTVNEDVTKGYVVGSRWVLDSGDVYVCSDPTEGASVWDIEPDFVPYTGATEDVDLGTHDLYTNKLWLFDEPNGNHASLHYTDDDFHIEHANGDKMFVIEDGFIQLHKTNNIQSNLWTTDLTETQDHFLPDQSGTIALTSDITKEAVGLGNVDNTSDANKAFTAAQITSLVFDKARLPKVIPAVAIAGSAGISGAVTTEVVLQTLTIPANTLSVGDVIRISGIYSYTTTGTKTPRVRFGTTTGGTAILQPPGAIGATITSTQVELYAIVTSSTNLRFVLNNTTNALIFSVNTGAMNNITIDRSVSNSFVFTVQKNNAGDTAVCETAFLEIITS
jgi:hypothetical protein